MSDKKVYESIAKVTELLSKSGISKDRKNDQQGYKFRGIDDVYNALAPVLAEAKLCVLPNVLERECVERQTAKGNAIFYVTVKVDFAFVSAEDGSTHSVVTYGEAMDSGDKATNKAMSAAYKYAAMQAFCIPTEGDNDADAQTHEVRPKSPADMMKSASGASFNEACFEAMPDDEKDFLKGIANKVGVYLKEGADLDAYSFIEAQRLDDQEKPALWHLLDSKQRSAIKKAGESLRLQQKAEVEARKAA